MRLRQCEAYRQKFSWSPDVLRNGLASSLKGLRSQSRPHLQPLLQRRPARLKNPNQISGSLTEKSCCSCHLTLSCGTRLTYLCLTMTGGYWKFRRVVNILHCQGQRICQRRILSWILMNTGECAAPWSCAESARVISCRRHQRSFLDAEPGTGHEAAQRCMRSCRSDVSDLFQLWKDVNTG